MERVFKGIWIPAEIWENDQLSWNEKILLMEIDSFTAKGKECFFSNEYIQQLLGVTERSARRLLSQLIEKGFVSLVRFDGRNRYVESLIKCGHKCPGRPDTNDRAERTQMSGQTGHECPNTNTSNNTINDNKRDSKGAARFVKPSIDEIRAYCEARGNGIDAGEFFDHYESNGWQIGKTPMKDWKASVRTWERKRANGQAQKPAKHEEESTYLHNLRVADKLFGTHTAEDYLAKKNNNG